MIEVIYKEENQEAQNGEGTFGLPKNIRQIGLIREDYKIYMEDYVYTFLVRLARAEEAGKTENQSGSPHRGDKVAGRNHISFYQRSCHGRRHGSGSGSY